MRGEVSIERIRQIAERVAGSEGLEVVDVEFRGSGPRSLLRIFIDKPSGVTHRDCELVSSQVSAILDVEDFISSSYTLEVSSPGLERRLHRPADYTRFTGKKVKLILREPVEGQRSYTGTLGGLQGGTVLFTSDRGKQIEVAFDNIERANLVFEWKPSAPRA